VMGCGAVCVPSIALLLLFVVGAVLLHLSDVWSALVLSGFWVIISVWLYVVAFPVVLGVVLLS